MKKSLSYMYLSVSACLAVFISSFAVTSCSKDSRYAYIHLPATEDCSDTSTGKKTTWSCVYYGSYPASEVVDSKWNAIDGYALQEGDVIRDDELYSRLESSSWNGDYLELDSVKYYRVGQDAAPASEEVRENHYYREADRQWHYFVVKPIRWRVLDISGNKALLLADRMPDSIPFHDKDEEVCWSSSSLRKWLNGEFTERAFAQEEKEAILTTEVENLPNQSYGTSSGGNTEDKVFILSNAEVFESDKAGRYGFEASRDHDDPARRFTSTAYAKFMGAWWSPVDVYAGNSFWFMRNSGYTAESVTYICDFGFVYSRGTLVTCSDAAVLPAMWIDLDKAKIEDAGERSSTDILHPASKAQNGLHDPVKVEVESMPGGAYTVWSSVTFGRYPQKEISAAEPDSVETGGRYYKTEPVRWRVLKVEDDSLLLMADRILDSVPYNDEYRDCTWEDSYIRGWLNGPGDSFINNAFTEEERQALILSDVSNADNHYFGTKCGNNTKDYVFLLSEEEVFSSYKAELYGFRPDDAVGDVGRRLSPTDYAAAGGAWVSASGDTAGTGFWFLRTNGYTSDNVVYVGEKGFLYNRGIPVTCSDAGVVPVIRVRKDSSLYTVCGDVSYKGE